MSDTPTASPQIHHSENDFDYSDCPPTLLEQALLAPNGIMVDGSNPITLLAHTQGALEAYLEPTNVEQRTPLLLRLAASRNPSVQAEALVRLYFSTNIFQIQEGNRWLSVWEELEPEQCQNTVTQVYDTLTNIAQQSQEPIVRRLALTQMEQLVAIAATYRNRIPELDFGALFERFVAILEQEQNRLPPEIPADITQLSEQEKEYATMLRALLRFCANGYFRLALPGSEGAARVAIVLTDLAQGLNSSEPLEGPRRPVPEADRLQRVALLISNFLYIPKYAAYALSLIEYVCTADGLGLFRHGPPPFDLQTIRTIASNAEIAGFDSTRALELQAVRLVLKLISNTDPRLDHFTYLMRLEAANYYLKNLMDN